MRSNPHHFSGFTKRSQVSPAATVVRFVYGKLRRTRPSRGADGGVFPARGCPRGQQTLCRQRQSRSAMNGYKRCVLHFMKVGEADRKLISACSRNEWKWKRLPLSGSRRIFWRDGGE